MRTSLARHTLLLPLLLAVFSFPRLEAQVPQAQIARALVSNDRAEQARAVDQLQQISPRDMGPELRAALMTAVRRQNALRRDHMRALERGETGPEYEEHDNLDAELTRALVALRDPQTIPVLAGALGTGLMVVRALAAFGEEALPAVVATIESPESFPGMVSTGLITLRFMVEAPRGRPLSVEGLEEVRRVAMQQLTGERPVTVLWRAIDLAVALEDPDLRIILQSLAADPNQVVARGEKDPALIERTQQRAANALAGVPPVPRPR